jgi:hypothetical protein
MNWQDALLVTLIIVIGLFLLCLWIFEWHHRNFQRINNRLDNPVKSGCFIVGRDLK